MYSDIHKYDVTNSEWNKKVSSAAGANKEIPSDKLEAMSTFLGKMNGVMSDKSTLEMIQYLGTFSTRDLNPDNIKSKLDQRYKNAIDFLPNKDVAHKLWYNLGLCLKKKGDLAKAIEMFEKSAALAPQDFDKVGLQIRNLTQRLKEQEDKDEPADIDFEKLYGD